MDSKFFYPLKIENHPLKSLLPWHQQKNCLLTVVCENWGGCSNPSYPRFTDRFSHSASQSHKKKGFIQANPRKLSHKELALEVVKDLTHNSHLQSLKWKIQLSSTNTWLFPAITREWLCGIHTAGTNGRFLSQCSAGNPA